MSTALEDVQQDPDERTFDILTTHNDDTRANLQARGVLDAASAPLLAEVIAGHLRACRRFLRLDVAGLAITDAEALATLAQAHQSLLAARGTLILTGVTEPVRSVLAGAGLDTQLFLVDPLA